MLWINLRQAFYDDIMVMYQTLRSQGKLSYDKVETAFEEHQAKWSEAIFNEDSYFKYLAPMEETGTELYLPMLQGSKAEQRKWWLYNRFRYMDSKYNAGDSLTDFITLRGYAKDDITITPYADVYASVKYGSYLVQTRAARNEDYTLECPLDNVNDTEIYIYSASQLKDVGDLSGLKVGLADFSMATKLQAIKVGDSDTSYTNGNLTTLTLGNNVLLKTIDVRNCPNLVQAVDISGCVNVEEIYFDGTKITGLNLPNGGILKKLHLPDTVTNLTIRNQPSITEFVMPSYDNITTLRLENVSNSIDSLDIIETIEANSRVRLIGIDWNFGTIGEAMAAYTILDSMRGLDENGNNMPNAQVSGRVYVPSLKGSELALLQSRYPNVIVTYDHVDPAVNFYNGLVLLGSVDVAYGFDATYDGDTPTKVPTAQYIYTFAGWSLTNGGDADPDALINVTESRSVYAAYTPSLRSYSLRFYNDTTLITTRAVEYGSNGTYVGSTPTKADTPQYTYSFNGWSLMNGGSANANALQNITADRDVYAAFISTVRTYTVKFVNDSSGTVVTLQTNTGVAYGSSVSYTGETPVSAVNASLEFRGWNPSPRNITGNTTCYAQFEPLDAEITDDWDTIIANTESGAYKTAYRVGNYKPIDLGAEGTINMQIVAFDTDDKADGSGKAAITWIAKELLVTSRKMNSTKTSSGGWEATELRAYLKNTIKPLIPLNVRNAIVSVTKKQELSSSGGVQGVQTSVEDIWIPSAYELYGGSGAGDYRYNEIYRGTNDAPKRKYGSGTSSQWWLRSAASNSGFFRSVTENGSASPVYDATYDFGVAVGFCI